MFSIQNRGELPEVVEREFENLISRLNKMLLAEHNSDGTHKGADFSGSPTSATVVNGIVTVIS